jgi:protein-S-isoprenylcysteine O-methyltransferase Ste14
VVERLAVTLLPAIFLTVLFGGGAVFHRRNIDQDGTPPIHKVLFYSSKYLIVAMWVATILNIWGINLAFVRVPPAVRGIALALWILGFALMFTGRFGLGESFRLGSAKESTALRVGGLFRLSRHPMYIGVFATQIAAVLYTLNPIMLAVAVFVIAVHHKIAVAEEAHLRTVFGGEYTAYCRHVRRYL